MERRRGICNPAPPFLCVQVLFCFNTINWLEKPGYLLYNYPQRTAKSGQNAQLILPGGILDETGTEHLFALHAAAADTNSAAPAHYLADGLCIHRAGGGISAGEVGDGAAGELLPVDWAVVAGRNRRAGGLGPGGRGSRASGK